MKDLNDPLVIVTDLSGNELPRYMAWIEGSTNYVYCWVNGCTSLTADKVRLWKKWRYPSEEDYARLKKESTKALLRAASWCGVNAKVLAAAGAVGLDEEESE